MDPRLKYQLELPNSRSSIRPPPRRRGAFCVDAATTGPRSQNRIANRRGASRYIAAGARSYYCPICEYFTKKESVHTGREKDALNSDVRLQIRSLQRLVPTLRKRTLKHARTASRSVYNSASRPRDRGGAYVQIFFVLRVKEGMPRQIRGALHRRAARRAGRAPGRFGLGALSRSVKTRYLSPRRVDAPNYCCSRHRRCLTAFGRCEVARGRIFGRGG